MIDVINDSRVRVSKGDDATLECVFEDWTIKSGQTYTFAARDLTGTTVLSKVASSMNTSTNTVVFKFTRAETSSLPTGTYQYDISVVSTDLGRYTFNFLQYFVVEEIAHMIS